VGGGDGRIEESMGFVEVGGREGEINVKRRQKQSKTKRGGPDCVRSPSQKHPGFLIK